MFLPRRLTISATVLLAGLCILHRGHASPAPPSTAAGAGAGSESVRAVDEASSETDTATTDTATTNTATTNTDTTAADMVAADPTTLDPATGADVERHTDQQMFAVPLPTRCLRSGDKRLRQDRGMLAAGIIFTAVCGAGFGLGVWAVTEQRGRTYGQETRNAVAAMTSLLTCTIGAVALAATGAARLKKRRGR